MEELQRQQQGFDVEGATDINEPPQPTVKELEYGPLEKPRKGSVSQGLLQDGLELVCIFFKIETIKVSKIWYYYDFSIFKKYTIFENLEGVTQK